MSDFEAFTEAVTSRATHALPQAGPKLERIAILGGGTDARLLAALAIAEGVEVRLFSAYGTELDELRSASGISVRGAGPVGTYQIDQARVPSVQTTAEIDSAVQGADAIFFTGPVHKYRTYAMVLADHVVDGQIIVLPEGRSLGALEASWLLRVGGCSADVTLVEIQGLPFWTQAEGNALALSSRSGIAAATLPSGRVGVIDALSAFYPGLVEVDSVLASGFADGSALVELPALLMSGGGEPLPMGAVPLPENDTFAAGLGAGQLKVIDALADERRAVARAFGVRNLPDTDDWVAAYAGETRGDGARPVPQNCEGIIRDGIIGSLVPLLSAADLLGQHLPMTQAMVTLGSAVLTADIASAGRRLETIGVQAADVDTARKTMDAIAKGRS